MTGAAARDEQAELNALREAADRSAAEAGETLAALAGKLAQTAHPGAWLRRRVVRHPLAAGLGGGALLLTAVLVVLVRARHQGS